MRGLVFKKWVIRHYQSFPRTWQVGLFVLVLLLFNLTTWPYLKFGVENAIEASYFWVDEGRHLQTLEYMQETHSLQLIHPAYTAFYPNLSYLSAWLINRGERPISAKAFAWGSKGVSLISLNLHLLIAFALCYAIFSSFGWALLGLILLAGQRLNLTFASWMHPEALMLLFTALALYAGTRLLIEGKPKYLWAMAAATGLGVGTKLQLIFLIPWGGVLFLLMLWKFRRFSLQRFLGWSAISGIILVATFFVASPYQVIHLADFIQGVRGESLNITDYYQGRYSAWKWLSQVTSELHLGPYFSLLFLLSCAMGIKRLIVGGKQEGWALLNRPPEVLLIGNLLWILIGAGYIVTTYRVFTNRYLIHIHISLILVILLGLYWWVQEKRPFYHITTKILILILLYGGIQGQWRHTRRDIERREKIYAQMEPHRQFGRELPQHVPVDAHVLHTIRVYISPKLYPRARPLFSEVSSTILGQSDLDFLIVNNNYRPAMRAVVPMRGSQQDTVDAIAFWNRLEKDGLDGLFTIVAHYPEINVTIYRKMKQTQ